jgi:hypothetical protein
LAVVAVALGAIAGRPASRQLRIAAGSGDRVAAAVAGRRVGAPRLDADDFRQRLEALLARRS